MLNTMSSQLFPFRSLLSGLILLLLPLCAASADNWIEVKSPHFTVQTTAGEKEARKVADQFEQIRNMFHTAFATLQVDPPQPIIIVAVKNENGLKLFLPEAWEVKGHVHPAGFYQPADDKDYVVMRLDTEGDNPFHTLYHEYTHALLRLNFSNSPLWLNEGLAEFFGNSILGEKEIKTGTIDPGHLYLLNQSKLIPIETLLEIDHNSPYYNESNRASVFYAESWAVVHFLMLDEEARKKELLKNFLTSWGKSGNQIEAARESFGDLRQFGKSIESYERQGTFRIGVIKAGQQAADKTYTARNITPGETLAIRGDFLTHHNRAEQAGALLEEAAKNEPNLAFVHEALGYYHYRRQEVAEADREMMQAIKLGANGFAPLYFHAFLSMQHGSFEGETMLEAASNLEKAIQLNPQFAPAYEALAQAYSHSPDKQKQAVTAGIKAVQLDPGHLPYAINLGYLLLSNSRFAEARIMAKRILAAATTPQEKDVADSMLQHIQQAEEWAAKKTTSPVSVADGTSVPAPAEGGTNSGDAPKLVRRQGMTKPETPGNVPVDLTKRAYGVDGPIGAVDCAKKPEVIINLDLPSGPVSFHAPDFRRIALSWADGVPEPSLGTCTQWKGRSVKLWFSPTPGKEYAGDISKIYFY
jgi:Flp pilus assembly protein TadD